MNDSPRLQIAFAAVAALILAAIACPAIATAAGWQAGVATAVITPDRPMWMSGYGGRDHVAEGKVHDLHAKALVLDDGNGERAVLVTFDLVGIGRDVSAPMCEAIAERYGFERRQIALCASHTHCGPVVAKNLGTMYFLTPEQWSDVAAYAATLHQKVLDLVGRAVADLAPCELRWGNGRATFAVNRRNNPEADVPRLRAEGRLVGPNDFDVPVLAVYGADGNLRSVVCSYACHATVMSFYEWCGDYPGFAQLELERRHPGAVALFFAGCGADQNPLPRRKLELAADYGSQLADAVDRVLAGTTSPIAGPLRSTFREIELPFDRLPTRAELERAAAMENGNRNEVRRAQLLLARLDAGETLAPYYPYPVETWKLGDGPRWILLGGEDVVDYSIRLKAELGGERTWVAGYSNDVMAYIPSRRVLFEGGYEGATSMIIYGQPTTWAPELEEAIVREVHRQAEAVVRD